MAPKTPLEEPTHFAKINPNELIGVWLSLVERLVRDQEVVGSNPIAPTISTPRHWNPGGAALVFLDQLSRATPASFVFPDRKSVV